MLDAAQTNLRRSALLTQSTGLGRVKTQTILNALEKTLMEIQ